MNSDTSESLDLYVLHLLRLVAIHRSFTAAAKSMGLSQSALSRQVLNIESRLNLKLFERTTRSVKITEAGAILLRETEAIPNILRGALRRIAEECQAAERQIKVGISQDLALAHIPGIFHAATQIQPSAKLVVSQSDGREILKQTASAQLDLGILTDSSNYPETVRITHRMKDQFTIITAAIDHRLIDKPSLPDLRKWAASRNWLMPPSSTPTRGIIDAWANRHRLKMPVSMELESFDLTVQLVSMGMGAALVPRRSLSPFPRKGKIAQVRTPSPLVRELIVISPTHSRCPEHVAEFVGGILFS
jgi:DNA-binding transcriptional LysR family regulator